MHLKLIVGSKLPLLCEITATVSGTDKGNVALHPGVLLCEGATHVLRQNVFVMLRLLIIYLKMRLWGIITINHTPCIHTTQIKHLTQTKIFPNESLDLKHFFMQKVDGILGYTRFQMNKLKCCK